MCIMLYLAAPQPIPLVELKDDDVGLVVANLTNENEAAKQHFGTEHVYFVSTHDGCACTFGVAADVAQGGIVNCILGVLFPKLLRASKRKQSAGYRATCELKEYLTTHVTVAGFSLYSCWAGDEGETPDPELQASMTLQQFFAQLETTGLEERQMIRLLST